MNSDPVLFLELPIIQKIIRDETWLESERRGRRVDANDPVVRENVCQIVLRIGQQLREALSAAACPAMVPVPVSIETETRRIVTRGFHESESD